MTLDEGHLLFVMIVTYGKVSLWLWKSLENSGNFFSYFVATLIEETRQRGKARRRSGGIVSSGIGRVLVCAMITVVKELCLYIIITLIRAVDDCRFLMN